MPIIGLNPDYMQVNPVLAGIVISIFLLVAIVRLVQLKEWGMCTLSLGVWLFLLIVIFFGKELANIGPMIGGPINPGF
ncbi:MULTISPECIES: hypothetical protein [Bacillus cereus group]|uniref:Uncharacterized protein n=3 Tax=Bacillus cereus group TaxID=86661 RepID=A0A9X6X3W2_BACCE|nr:MULTISPECIES: hypothetical protein [Bacillus cereus group]HDR5353805.1 hypothetical protein [Bacillus thuringiensis]MEB9624042.1 hypothetical protein [Bacillus cereus]OTW56049.1 hypothetical protein BK699_00090 [Bacillus thuringiensis serovar mexicanensis]OUB44773.1 hypothetical protein BK741_21735 [Bacillus thuringiensis serovar iberica]PFK24596.1 hypothetical protein COI98_05320 [Bacillus cereus]